MPPAWSPEKRNAREFNETNEDFSLHPGYVTPPRNSPEIEERNQLPEKEARHIKWILSKFPKLENIFKLHRQVGEGTFSAVFVASLLNDHEQTKLFAIKHLVPTTHPKRIQVELSCLKLIGGQDNVVGIDLCMREKENILFVMPYLKHKPFTDYVSNMNVEETATYIKNLLKAVARVHKFNIIHRDIKPSNFLYDRKNQKFLLVDFGLAQVCGSKSSEPEKLNTAKRKRETEIISETSVKSKDLHEPAAKRPVLQKRNMNSLNNTVYHLQTTLNKTLPKQSKENIKDCIQPIVKKSPFKSPMKNIAAKIMKSPYKFTGLDLPPTHSNFQGKMPGQRRLFMDEESIPKSTTIKFQKSFTCVTVTSRMPNKTMSPTEKKLNQIKQTLNEDCKCFNRASICSVCLLRKAQEAPRAGTPGFRPPEVLLKYNNQTTAVDIWAIGVIMLCILSGTYPFFRAPDDITALAELITLFGNEQVKKVAKVFGQHFICSQKKPPLDLRKVCYRLRNRDKRKKNTSNERCKLCEQFLHNCLCIGDSLNVDDDIYPDSAYDLLRKLLDVDPFKRITAEDALNHPFLNEF